MSALEELRKALEESEDNEQLNFSEIKIGEITDDVRKFFEQLENVEVLLLRNCGLLSLKNFPLLKKVEVIDFSENNLTDDGSLSVLKPFSSLSKLFLNSNNIKSIETILQLKNNNLEQIDCSDNPVAELKDFSNKIFEAFEKIEVVNGFDKNGKEVEDQEPEDELEDDEDDEDDDDDEYGDSDEEQFEDDDEDYESEGEELDGKAKKRNKSK